MSDWIKIMSRTYRNLQGIHKYALRHPKTSNERKALLGLIQDNYVEDYQVSGLNHLHHRLSHCPTSWDDQVIGAFYQEDHKAV